MNTNGPPSGDKRIDLAELPTDITTNRDARGVLAGWVRLDDHPDGLLGKPCPTCGYKYGTKWLFEEVPDEILTELKEMK